MVKSLGGWIHEQLSNYRSFIFDCNKKYNWYAINIYDVKHRARLSQKPSLVERLAFSSADPELLPTILDSSAIKLGAPRCPRCKSFDHIQVKLCPFPEGLSKGSTKQATTSQTAQTENCFNFNHNRCAFGEKCRRLHICRLCKGPLPFSKCSISGACRDKGKDIP